MGNDCTLSFTFYIDLLLKKNEYFKHFLFFKVDFNKYTIQWPMDTLKMMLFTKYLIKENALAESAENFGIGLI